MAVYSCWQACITSDEGGTTGRCQGRNVGGGDVWALRWAFGSHSTRGQVPCQQAGTGGWMGTALISEGHWRGTAAGLCPGNVPQGRLDSAASAINNWRFPRMFLLGVLSCPKGAMSFGWGESDINTYLCIYIFWDKNETGGGSGLVRKSMQC